MDIEKLLQDAGISILPGFDLEEDETAFPGGIDVTEMHKVKRFAALVLEEAAKVCDQRGNAFTATGESAPYGDGRHNQRAYGADCCGDDLRHLSRRLTTPPQEPGHG